MNLFLIIIINSKEIEMAKKKIVVENAQLVYFVHCFLFWYMKPLNNRLHLHYMNTSISFNLLINTYV